MGFSLFYGVWVRVWDWWIVGFEFFDRGGVGGYCRRFEARCLFVLVGGRAG